MRTDPLEIDGGHFDLLVVGGGLQGAAIAREAASRDAKVLLVDAADFASGSSSRTSRLVHGGLRHLQHGHFAQVKAALTERERMLRLCPHLVRPAPMVMPFFRDGPGSRLLTGFSVRAYSWLAARSTLPAPRRLSAAAAERAFPGLRTVGLRGALQFYDAATNDARLCLANVQSAAQLGARVVNHCAVVGLAADGAVRLRDELGGREVKIRALHVINASGARVDAVRALLGTHDGEARVRVTRSSHVVLDPRPGETALAAFLPDRRFQTVVPHTDGTVCGTTEVDDEPGEAGPTVPEADVQYLLDALGFLLAPAPRREDLRHAFAAWRALPARPGPAGRVSREPSLVPEALQGATLYNVVGGTLTTHRAFAERAIAQVLSLSPEDSPTRELPLPGAAGPREVTDALWWRHGSQAADVRALAVEDGDWSRPLCPHRPALAAEAVHALRTQAAVTFADLMLRRLSHAQGPCLQRDCLRRAHDLFRRARLWAVDDDFQAATSALLAEVDHLDGGLRRRSAEVAVAEG